MIYFTRYILNKLITTLKLYYEELIGKIEKSEWKKYLMVDDFIIGKVLGKIKRISIKNREDTKILIDTDDKLPDNINGMCY